MVASLSYLFVVAGFFAAVLLLEGVYIIWDSHRGPEAQRIGRRLRAVSNDRPVEVSIVKRRPLSGAARLDRMFAHIPGVRGLDRLLEQSGLALKVGGFVGATVLAVSVGGGMATLLHLPVIIVFFVAFALGLLPAVYVMRAQHRRLTTLDDQLPDVLDLMARVMRAGHAFPSALQIAGEELPDPIGAEFRTTFEEVNFGISQQAALSNLADRVASTDLRYFVIAALIQRETGGNLAELLNGIAMIVRSRQKFQRSVRVLTAEGRLSAWILVILPFAFAGVLFLINPEFISVLWAEPAGLSMVYGALGLMVLGMVWMSRIVRVRV
jgi:tight adherence protein B